MNGSLFVTGFYVFDGSASENNLCTSACSNWIQIGFIEILMDVFSDFRVVK